VDNKNEKLLFGCLEHKAGCPERKGNVKRDTYSPVILCLLKGMRMDKTSKDQGVSFNCLHIHAGKAYSHITVPHGLMLALQRYAPLSNIEHGMCL
jgi:hypothetical protein